jgi:hypothetical protein
MLVWREDITTKEEALEVLTELKRQGIRAYYLDWLGRVVFNPRDKKIKILAQGRPMEGMSPSMARWLGGKITSIFDVRNSRDFRKIWDSL